MSPEDKSKKLSDLSIEGLRELDGFMKETAQRASPESSDELQKFSEKLRDAVQTNMERRIGHSLPRTGALPEPPDVTTPHSTTEPSPQQPTVPRAGRRFTLPPRRSS